MRCSSRASSLVAAAISFVCLIGSHGVASAQSNRGCVPGAVPGPVTIDGTRFRVNGNPTFLTFISYFGGTIRPLASNASEASIVAAENAAYADAQSLFPTFCNAGFNAIRLFVDFWYSDFYGAGGQGFKPSNHAVIAADGNLNDGAAGRPNRLANLLRILDLARAHGLVVDLSFAYEVVANRSKVAHGGGVQRLALLLSDVPSGNDSKYNHVMFDVQNEFNATGILTNELAPLLGAGRLRHPSSAYTRIVFVSTAGLTQAHPSTGPTVVPDTQCYTSTPSAITTWKCLLATHLAGTDVFAVHESRDYETAAYPNGQNPWWNTFVPLNIQNAFVPANATPKPIYLQEPDRWMQAYPNVVATRGTPCNPNYNPWPQWIENPCELDSWALTASAANAFRTGVAAWTFHTEYFFFPGTGLRIASTPELQVLGLAAGGQSLRNALGMGSNRCWGELASAYWITGWARAGQWPGLGDCTF